MNINDLNPSQFKVVTPSPLNVNNIDTSQIQPVTNQSKVPAAASYFMDQANGILPYGAINKALAPTDNPNPLSSAKGVATGVGNYVKSVAKAGVGLAQFYDPVSYLKNIVETGKAAIGYHKDVTNAAQSRLDLEANIQKLQDRITQDKQQGKDTTQLEAALSQVQGVDKQTNLHPGTAGSILDTNLMREVPSAAYKVLAPPTVQQGIAAGVAAKKNGMSTGGAILEGAGTGLQNLSQDPGQALPYILAGEQAMEGTPTGEAINRGVAKVASPAQAVVDMGKPLASAALDAAKSAGGTAVDFAAEQAKKAIPTILTKSAEQMRTEKMNSGLAKENNTLVTVNKAFKDNTKVYTATDPVTGESTKTMVTPGDTLTKYKIPMSNIVKDGKIQLGDARTGQGQLGQIQDHIRTLDDNIDSKLVDTGKTVPTETLRQQALAQANADPEITQSGTIPQVEAQINSKFDSYQKSYGDAIPVTKINGIRKTMNSPKNYDPSNTDVHNNVGDVARQVVYDAHPEAQDLLREQGNLISARKYLNVLNMKTVKGGALTNLFARSTGAVAGGIVGSTLGPIGGAAGAATGLAVGEGIIRGAKSLQFNSPLADIRGAAENVGKKIFPLRSPGK